MSRTLAALLAGAVAIALNIAALAAADLVPLATARGGLLRLLVMLTGGALQVPAGGAFQLGFHAVVGLAMALFYALALEPVLRGPSWLRGLIYAVAVWLANAAVVLPATGEGFAGSRHLTLPAWSGLPRRTRCSLLSWPSYTSVCKVDIHRTIIWLLLSGTDLRLRS